MGEMEFFNLNQLPTPSPAVQLVTNTGTQLTDIYQIFKCLNI